MCHSRFVVPPALPEVHVTELGEKSEFQNIRNPGLILSPRWTASFRGKMPVHRFSDQIPHCAALRQKIVGKCLPTTCISPHVESHEELKYERVLLHSCVSAVLRS